MMGKGQSSGDGGKTDWELLLNIVVVKEKKPTPCVSHTHTHTVQNSVIILNICAQVQSVHKSVSKSPGSSQETKSVCVVQSRNQTVFVVKCGSSTVFEWTTDKTTTTWIRNTYTVWGVKGQNWTFSVVELKKRKERKVEKWRVNLVNFAPSVCTYRQSVQHLRSRTTHNEQKQIDCVTSCDFKYHGSWGVYTYKTSHFISIFMFEK